MAFNFAVQNREAAAKFDSPFEDDLIGIHSVNHNGDFHFGFLFFKFPNNIFLDL